MPDKKKKSGVLPTKRATKEQTVILVQSLLVTWKVLEHLESKGIPERRLFECERQRVAANLMVVPVV